MAVPPNVAYLVNQYPKISHSFIRREILALEAQGVEVKRFSLRSQHLKVIDTTDKAELESTRAVLDEGITGLLVALLKTAVTQPQSFIKGLGLTLKLVSQPSERGLLFHLAYLAEACVLLGWLQSAMVTHLHAHFGTNSATVAMLCQALGGPDYSFTVHGPEEFDKVQAIALPEKIKRAKFVVAISSFGKSQLYRWCDVNYWDKIYLVRCGLDGAFLAQPYTPIPPTPKLVCVGRLSEQKGHLLLIEAARQLAMAGIDFKLCFVGDGELRGTFEVLIEKYCLQNYVEITGWATEDEVRQHLLTARAMVLPSFAEGLPVVIMESLALGRPVISTYVAGIPELIEPKVCGWLIPAGSVDPLKAAMEDALRLDLAILESMGKAGMQRVLKYHDIKQEALKLISLFSRDEHREKNSFIV